LNNPLQVQNLESPIGNEYLNSGLFATIPNSLEFPPPIDSSSHWDSLQPHNSQPELNTVATLRKSSLPTALKRNSSAGATLTTLRSSTLSTPPTGKKRNSGIGAASSHGRLFKVLGDLFLLSGRCEDATIW
jgi:hypothetical protein